MRLNIDLLKKKFISGSNYRETKKREKLLGSFTKKYIDLLSLKELTELEKLLDVDDTNLYNYYNDLDYDFDFKENYINSLFKNFKYNDE